MDERLRTTAASLLEPGETIEATGRARPGRVSVKANVALAAAALVLSGGNATMHARKKDVFVVLTNRRLLILEAHWLTFRPVAKILGALNRPLSVTDVKRGVTTSFVVSVPGDTNGLRLVFPTTERRDARALLTALGVPASYPLQNGRGRKGAVAPTPRGRAGRGPR
jgi:hypothetical protein